MSFCLQTEQLAIFATASTALSNVIKSLDQMTDVVRSLVGERDLDALEHMYEQRAALVDAETTVDRIA
jgi:hypothetical protein